MLDVVAATEDGWTDSRPFAECSIASLITSLSGRRLTLSDDELPFDDPLSFDEMAQALSGGPVSVTRIDRFVRSKPDLNGWVNDHGMSILHVAAAHGQTYAIVAFAKSGCRRDAADSSGWTALHHAVDFDWVMATQDGNLPSDLPTASVLLELGVDDAIQDNHGETAADLASRVPRLYDDVKRKVLSRKSSRIKDD